MAMLAFLLEYALGFLPEGLLALIAFRIAAFLEGTSLFHPFANVSAHSVFILIVMHGTPSSNASF